MEKLTPEIIFNFPKSSFKLEHYYTQVENLKLKTPMKLPFGEVSHRPSGTVEIFLNVEGTTISGYGEGATLPKPVFTDDSGENIDVAANELLSFLQHQPNTLNKSIRKIREFNFSDNGRHPTARMMVEMAIVDALAKANNVSVADALGIYASTIEVPFGKSLGGGSYENTISEAEDSISRGAKKIKLKITPETSLTVIEVINYLNRKHSSLELMVDANGSFDATSVSDIDLLQRIDKQNLIMIEEPVSRKGSVKGYQAVELLRSRLKLNTPICLDDCLVDLDTTRSALTKGIADIVNIKPGRIGSIFSAFEVAELSKKHNRQLMVGGMLEATPGRAMTTVLAAYFHQMGSEIPGDLSLAQERLSQDLVDTSRQLSIGPNGGILIPRNPGWGY